MRVPRPGILSKLAQTTAALTRLKPVWNDKSICVSSKIRLMRCLFKSIFLYTCFFFGALLWGYSRAPKKNTKHGNEVLPQDAMHLIHRPCYQRESPCQDPAGNRTVLRPPDHHKETQTAVVLSCLPLIRSGQNYLARHSKRGRKTMQTEEEVGRQHQRMDRPEVRQVP